jgi:hypothetical protein
MSKFATLVVALSFAIGCQNSLPASQERFEPLSLGASNEVYRVCGQTLGVSCSMNAFLHQLTITVDMTGTPEETQRGVAFVSTYYCRLSRLEGNEENRVLLVRPDGTQVGRACSTIGTIGTSE